MQPQDIMNEATEVIEVIEKEEQTTTRGEEQRAIDNDRNIPINQTTTSDEPMDTTTIGQTGNEVASDIEGAMWTATTEHD